MPYADEAQQRQAQRDWWRAQYAENPSFRRKELRRKKLARASWSAKRKAKDRAYMREFMRRYRAKLKEEKDREKARLKKGPRRVIKTKVKPQVNKPSGSRAPRSSKLPVRKSAKKISMKQVAQRASTRRKG